MFLVSKCIRNIVIVVDLANNILFLVYSDTSCLAGHRSRVAHMMYVSRLDILVKQVPLHARMYIHTCTQIHKLLSETGISTAYAGGGGDCDYILTLK